MSQPTRAPAPGAAPLPITRTVLLLHELRDGSSHYDWMIERPSVPGEGEHTQFASLVTFRIGCRIDRFSPSDARGGVVDFLAERIHDHRLAYLTFEGEVSNGRGQITRLAEGVIERFDEDDARILVEGSIGAAKGTFRGQQHPDAWHFQFQPD